MAEVNSLIEMAIKLFREDEGASGYSPISEFNVGSRQARACFTAWAIMNRVDVDTYACDNCTDEIYTKSGLDKTVSKNDFEGFLYADIV